MAITDDKKLEVLHDHYKESFLYIRKREKQRDRLFVYVIVAIGILFLEVQYSDLITSVLDSVKLEFIEFNVSVFPISIFLNVTWIYLSTVILKYCQASLLIERQYEYLHLLEKKISKFLGKEDIYCREGLSYLDKYPIFSKLVWIYYSFLIPSILIVAIIIIIHLEWIGFLGLTHLMFDTVIVYMICVLLMFYKFYPLIQQMLSNREDKKVVKKSN